MTQHARLRHLAKYLTRAARNLGAGPISPALGVMLVRDLYEAIDGGTPFHAFLRDADALSQADAHAIGLAFAALDRLETRVRACDQPAMRDAAEIALRIAGSIHDCTVSAAL